MANSNLRAREKGVEHEFYTISSDLKQIKIWAQADMDADLVTAWSKGGGTDPSNCEMLCKSHNRAKGNR